VLTEARRAVLATQRPDGRARLVPIAFAVAEQPGAVILYSALDEKPKSVTDPRDLGRARDIAADPRVTVLVDRWSEDWQQLAWLRLDGRATLLTPTDAERREHALAVQLLRERYAQYADQHLERRPIMRIAIDRLAGWRARESA
jgi:PPOX class probable F420-dependent enzyme